MYPLNHHYDGLDALFVYPRGNPLYINIILAIPARVHKNEVKPVY